jgi:hypothetical protein
MEFTVHILRGEIINKITVRNAFNDLSDGKYTVTIERSDNRSLSQNAYYWAVVCTTVRDLLRNAGYNEVKTAGDAHEILKYKFLRKQIPNDQGEFLEIIQSTAKLSTVEFSIYTDAIVQWVAECFEHVIPAPGSQAAIF